MMGADYPVNHLPSLHKTVKEDTGCRVWNRSPQISGIITSLVHNHRYLSNIGLTVYLLVNPNFVLDTQIFEAKTKHYNVFKYATIILRHR